MPKVSGSSSETPFGAPSPGSTPTRMPSRTPMTISTRCCQLSAMVKPCRSASRFSTQALLPPLPACGERAEPPLSGARLAERSEARVRGWGERSTRPLTRSASPSRPLPAGGERVGRAEAHREPPQNPSAAPRRPRGSVTWKAQSNMTYSAYRGDARDHDRPRDGDVVLRHQDGEDVDRRRRVHAEERDRRHHGERRQEQCRERLRSPQPITRARLPRSAPAKARL